MDRHCMLFSCILSLAGLICSVVGFDSHLRGPSFLLEPPPRLEFSNSSGGWLDCSASGSPPPTVDWLSVDGSPVLDVHGVRRVLLNGTLILLPFAPAAYRQDIHSTVYRCVATNAVGRIVSRDVQVRAVVAQAYKVEVEVLGASRGCTAVLRCVVPSFVKDLIRVVSWVQEPSFYVYPSLQGDGKYHLLPTGELLVHNLEYNDQFPPFRCRSMHRLTRQVVVSSPANVRITEHRGLVSPAIVEHTGTVQVAQDEGAVLLCVSQGCPTPDYRWYTTQPGVEPVPVISGPRTRLLGPILVIEAVTPEDAGMYRCSASNAGGEASAELRLVVATPLHVEVTPPLLSVHLGGSAEFRCIETSQHSHQAAPSLSITWFKDGRPLPGPARSTGDRLLIPGVGREDRGMYQCLVRRAEGETAQAAAELQLGDAPPVLLYSFIEQTLQPGPAVSLKCSAAGNPTPQISWTLDGFPLPINGRFVIGQYVTVHGDVISHVNISHVTVEDGGEYTCTAENRAGRSWHSARLNVYGLPYIRLIPKVTAIAGEALHLKCPVAGYPIEEIRWERSSHELPNDLRQKVQSDGTLVINPVQKATDAGVYTCSAKNKQGHSARRSGEVAVIVPPKLSPFTSDEIQHVGERASLTCSVTKGDLPLTITWLKDGRPLDPSQRVSITQVDQFNSILLIESLSPDHNGNYSCVARNLAAEVSRTQQLVVNVPPSWVVEPADASVERNKHVMLHCQAQGVPQPTVVWKKATGSKSGEYEELRERVYTKLLSNGSLLLQNVKEDREGFYLCQADNGIGTGLGKVVQVKVNSSPYFSAPSRVVTVKKGDTATLQCDVNGDKPINVVWMQGGKLELTPASNYRVSIKQDSTPGGVRAELQIAGAETADSGSYFCQASNLYGHDHQLVQLLVQEPPKSPVNLESVMISSRSVKIQWQQQLTDSTEVTKYLVQYQESHGPWQQIELSGSPLQHTALIEDLKPATKYVFRVVAEGPAGRSGPSPELTVRTEPQRPAGPPLSVAVRPVSSTELLVTWSPPLAELRHGDIQGYNVGCRETSASSLNYNFTSVGGDGEEGGGELLLGGLGKFTKYFVVVQAFNQVGPGPPSEPATAQTMEDVPSVAPDDVRCAGLTSQSLQVSWQPPPTSQCNGILQGYKLFYEPVLDDQWQGVDEIESRKTTALMAVLTSLRRFTNYSIQVLAFTRIGDGVPTKPIICTTEEDAPGSPAEIKVVVSSPQSLLVSWLPPAEPNGIITKYNLYTRMVDGRGEVKHEKRNLPSQHTTFEVKGLDQRAEYQFWVTAFTRVGEGQSSRVVAQVPTSRVPARISSFGRTILRPFRSTASLMCHAVGQPTLRREWLRSDQILRGGSNLKIQIMDSGELLISDLQQSDSGNYTCQVGNSHGSDHIQYTLTVQVRPAPPTLYVSSVTSNSILLHWKPGDSGSAPISSYTLNYRRTQGELEEITLPRRVTSYELKGLYCGSAYHLYLAAQNKIGSSSPSPTLTVKTQGRAPGVPEGQMLLSPNSTSVLLRLHVWPDNDCPLTHFILQYRPVNSPHWTLVSNALKPQRRFIISGLNPASVYQLQIEAHNIAGSSKAEFTFITLTKEGESPPPELMQRGHTSQPFYSDVRVMVPLIIAIFALIGAGTAAGLCWRHKFMDVPTLVPEQPRPLKESLDNQQNAQTQRERYYATIHKVALQAGSDKIPGVKEALLKDAGTIVSLTNIPETSEDISPYATFQLSGPGADPHSTLLHSFMYHEQAMTEGCASPPPPAGLIKSSHRRGSRKTDVDTDESDSDPDQLTSSRTESSNQLDAGKVKHNFIYHGAQSSTSSDISPMSEQKSLPRRGRSSSCRWLVPSRVSLRTMLPPLTVAETTFGVQEPHSETGETPDRPELSEAECDIDTLKKLKLGLRSSLWSRPSAHNTQSDYSIAV